ncbi:MAG: 50S ribosomal protein L9 [Metamycoplasmataceae bacterium]
MKVIIIKNCKDGNVNDIIEVSPGYGINYLIKNGFAEPINKNSNSQLQKRLEDKNKIFQERTDEALILKEKIENLTLEFNLKTTNMIVHGSITTKKVNLKLKELGFNLNKYIIPHVDIRSLGITNIKLKLFDRIEANLKVLVTKSE